MNAIPFWKTWPVFYRRLFWVIAAGCVCAILFLCIADFYSPAPVFSPDRFQELEAQEIPIHRFQQGTTPVTILGDNYIVTDHVLGGALQPNLTASYIFLTLLVAGIVILLSVLTTLTRFWFYMGMGLFIPLVVSLRLHALELFGLTDQIPTVIILFVYGFVGYYFQFLRPSTRFVRRVATFLFITLVFGVTIAYASRIHHPLYFLSANALVAGAILTILFIFTVAHEIIAFFITVLTSSTKSTKSLRHFLIITAVYMINLALIYARKKYLIDWEFLPVNLCLIVGISGILGLWGFRQREPLYASFMRADPFGTYFFMALAGIGFGTMGYFLATANDPVTQIIQDAILYSHLGYGLIFFIYVIANFLSPLGANLQVHKVLYKPQTMPYFTFRLAGLIATFAFFAYSNWLVSVNQVYAGYHNALGDFYLAQDSLQPAEEHYRRSVFYATRNYHGHYALAEFDASRWDFEKEKSELQRLASGRPLDLAYLNYSRIHEISNSWRDALEVLNEGLIDFPENGLLQNTLGLVYAKLGREDSAMLLLNAAKNSAVSRAAAETNLMGLSAKFRVAYPADSLMNLLDPDNPGVKGNALALASGQDKSLEIDIGSVGDTVLTAYSAVIYNNYLIANHGMIDTSLVSRIVAISRKPSNTNFKNMLLAAAAHSLYANGEITKAFKLMHEVAFLGQQPRYYNILGLWSMEQGAPENAIHYFDQAALKNFKGSGLGRALALTETRDIDRAVHVWDSLVKSGEKDIQPIASKMIRLLGISATGAQTLVDEEKYEYSRHRFSIVEDEQFAKFAGTIVNEDFRARAIIDRSKQLEEADEPERALATLALTKGLRLSYKNLHDEILHLNLRAIAKQEQWALLQQKISSAIEFDGPYGEEKLYYEALLQLQAGKKNEAAKIFEWLAIANPFFEDAVVAAAVFSALNDEDKIKPYNILVNALDLNPNSVKLLKAYFIQAAHLDFDEPAKDALDKLHHLLSPTAFVQFVRENPDIFDITVN